MFQADGADVGHGGPAGQTLVDAHEVKAAQADNVGELAKREIVCQMLSYMCTNGANQAVVFGVVSRADRIMRQGKLEQRFTSGAYNR